VNETFGSLLRTLQQAQSQVRDLVAGETVTGAQLSVLAAVVSHPGTDQRGVSAATFIDKSTVASVVSNLVRRSLLTSSRDEADGRRDRLMASAAAVEFVYDASPRLVAGNEAALEALPSAAREKFMRLLEDLAYTDRREPPDRYVVPSPDSVRPAIEVPWGLGRSLRGCLQRYTRLWTEQFGALITPLQYLALKALCEAGEIDQHTLGILILLDKASLTAMLDRLQRRGLIARLRDPADGRRRQLKLTPPGRVLLSGADSQVATVDAEFVKPLESCDRTFFAGTLRNLAIECRSQLTAVERPA
jgi:DNA-binding MarR family transcriptional regulator